MDKKFNYNDLDLARVLVKRACKEFGVDYNLFPVTMLFDNISIEDKLNGGTLYLMFSGHYTFKYIKEHIIEAVDRHNRYLAKKKAEKEKIQEEYDKLTPEVKMMLNMAAMFFRTNSIFNSLNRNTLLSPLGSNLPSNYTPFSNINPLGL